MEYTAQDVMTLREKSGAGLIDCKNALTCTDGDIEKAAELLSMHGSEEIAQLKKQVGIAKRKAQAEEEKRERVPIARCDKCLYYSNESAGLLGRRYCTLLSHYEEGFYKRVYVSDGGSCDHYSERATRKNSNYKSNCFLTSAMVDYYCKDDDCEELTVLRGFRDGYMRTAEGGEELIKEYYEVAPKIVEFINSSDKKDKYYKYISEVVENCVKLISIKENERALTEYKFMVDNLKKQYNL